MIQNGCIFHSHKRSAGSQDKNPRRMVQILGSCPCSKESKVQESLGAPRFASGLKIFCTCDLFGWIYKIMYLICLDMYKYMYCFIWLDMNKNMHIPKLSPLTAESAQLHAPALRWHP